MRLALCLYRYTPFGGLERNALAIAEACVRRGHRVTVFTRGWEGERPAWLEVRELPSGALTNSGLDQGFARDLRARLAQEGFECVVGFNRLEGLDVFYAADPCFAAALGRRRWLAHALRRHRQRARWERAIFAPEAATEILVLSERERRRYREHYGTPQARLHVLPPGLRAEFLGGSPAHGAAVRAELGIPMDALLVLAVGSDFHRKGLDRTLRALARLEGALRERTWLAAVGAGRPGRYARLAGQLGLGERVRFTGGRDDVLGCYQAADLLLHPAREENTGTVLLEALSQGVPVVATAECGYAELVERAGAGVVLPSPFDHRDLDRALRALLAGGERRNELGLRGLERARRGDLARRFELAAEVIERAAERKALAVR